MPACLPALAQTGITLSLFAVIAVQLRRRFGRLLPLPRQSGILLENRTVSILYALPFLRYEHLVLCQRFLYPIYHRSIFWVSQVPSSGIDLITSSHHHYPCAHPSSPQFAADSIQPNGVSLKTHCRVENLPIRHQASVSYTRHGNPPPTPQTPGQTTSSIVYFHHKGFNRG
jgi:hypothetical protein